MLEVGQKIKLTVDGKEVATPKGVKTWKEKYGLYTPITGTITDILYLYTCNPTYVVKMDGEYFKCSTRGENFNTFAASHIEPVENVDYTDKALQILEKFETEFQSFGIDYARASIKYEDIRVLKETIESLVEDVKFEFDRQDELKELREYNV
jgi:hypothetical protein